MVIHRLGVKISIGMAAVSLAAALVSAAAIGRAAAAENPEDAAYVAQRLQEILEFEKTGVDIPWNNPTTGNRGMIRIERTYYQTPKLPCRVYRRTQVMDDELTMVVDGTGCRVGEARWFLDEKPPSVEGAAPKKTTSPEPKEPAAPVAKAPPSPAPAPSPSEESKSPEAPKAETPTAEKKAEVPKPRKKAESKPAKPPKPKTPEFTFQLPTRTPLPEGGPS
jgi:surface antigen